MSTRRVLIVEDELVVQLHLQRIVAGLGHEVVGSAADQSEALSIARGNPPHLVLTDIRLANGSDGVDTARALVQAHGCAVVFISAYADDATVERSGDVGAAGYLVKPFSAPQVRAAIKTAFASRDRFEREGLPLRLPVTDEVATEKRRFGAGTRLLLYSHDTFGLGHLRRCMALMRTLSERFPGISMLLVTGSPMVHRYAMPAGADYVKLPSLHKVGAERYEARSLQIPGADVVALRCNLILNAARDYQPNVLLADHSPAGGSGELVRTLEWLGARGGCTRIVGLRDIADDPDAVRKSWTESGAIRCLEEHYDHVVVYGNRDVFDPVSAYGLPASVAAKAVFVDYVCAGSVEEPPRSVEEEPADDQPSVFVTIGGGDGGGETVLVPFLQMMRRFADRIDYRADIVTGPFVDPWLHARIAELAEGLPVTVHEFLPSTRRFVERADVVVSTTGYNTATDILSWAKSSVFVPRSLYRQEQVLRARRLSELGLARFLLPDEVTPERFFEVIEAARRDDALPRARAAGLPLDGAARFGDFCAKLEVDVRPSLLDCPSGMGETLVSGPAEAVSWHEIGDLAALLDEESRLQLLLDSGIPAVSAEPTYIRLKPGTGALVGLLLRLRTGEGEIEIPGYVRTHDEERAAELMRKWHESRAIPTPIGSGVRLLSGGRSVLFLFPNDARIRGMRFVSEVDKLKRLLGEIDAIREGAWRVRGRKTVVETVRYKPERRLILRAELAQKNDATGEKRRRDVFVRFFTDDRGARIAEIRGALVGQAVDRHLPRCLGVAEGGRLFVEEAVPGGPLLPSVLAGTADAAAVAGVLHDLHASEVEGLPDLRVGDVFTIARECAANLARVEPAFGPSLESILEALRELQPAEAGAASVTLHGDCHLHQFLRTDEGPFVVDFERMMKGHPLFDLGHLCAHLTILQDREPAAAEAVRVFHDGLVRSYLSQNPQLDAGQLGFFVSCGILERALLPFRRLEAGWQKRCGELIELARAAIGIAAPQVTVDTEPWMVVHPRNGDSWPGWVVENKEKRFGVFARRLGRFLLVDPASDRELPGLGPWLASGELLNYRCGRRAILRLEGNRFVKIVRPRKARKLGKRMKRLARLAEQADLPEMPTLLEEDLENGAFVLSRVQGESLHRRLSRGCDDFAGIAGGLVALHGVELSGDDRLPRVTDHASLRTWAGFVGEVDRDLQSRCEGTIAAIESAGSITGPEDRLVHGDLHDKNLLVHGRELGIIDVDQAGSGNPATDLGNLAAHFVLRALQAGRPAESGRAIARRFLRAYAAAGGEFDERSITIAGARTLFRLACLYRFRKRWVHVCGDLLGEADHWIGGTI